MRYEIIFENNFFIAVNKPAGLLSVPDRQGQANSLKQMLRQHFGEVFTIHRLDKETSGIILFAKNENTHRDLSLKFEGRTVDKHYLGLVTGKPPQPRGTIDVPIAEHPGKQARMMTHFKGKPSVTDYEVLENFRSHSWIQFRIYTGRTHQIRVHMQHIGHPIACDELYARTGPLKLSSIKKNYKHSTAELEERPLLSRLALHSWKIKFNLYETDYDLEAELPKDLHATLQQLRKWA